MPVSRHFVIKDRNCTIHLQNKPKEKIASSVEYARRHVNPSEPTHNKKKN